MVVQVNQKEVEVFAGARVRDAVLKYAKDVYRSARSGETIITDKNSNPVDLDGELTNGQRLFTSPVQRASHDIKTDEEFL